MATEFVVIIIMQLHTRSKMMIVIDICFIRKEKDWAYSYHIFFLATLFWLLLYIVDTYMAFWVPCSNCQISHHDLTSN